MKVLHVVNDANTGGAQTLIEQLAHQVAPDIETHILVLLARGSLSSRFEACSATVTYLDLDKRTWRVDNLIRKTRSAITSLRPDIVHSHLLQADLAVAFASIRLDIPIISTVHTTGMSSQDPFRSRVLGRILGLISNVFIDRSIACGDGAASYMRRNGYALSKSGVISNGVALPVSQVVDDVSTQKSLLCLSRWHPMKDHNNLFEAFRLVLNRYPSSHLVCAGTGMTDANNDLLSLINAMGLREAITLLGPVQDVRSLLRESSGLVISSAYGEALPMAGLEALAEGIPVITTNVGDCPNLTVDSWQCVPPSRPILLADAICRLLSLQSSDYLKLSDDSVRIAQDDYSIGATAASYVSIYNELVSSKGGRHDARR